MSIVNIAMKIYKYCWLVVLSIGLGVCYADRVKLSNGGSFDGLVVEDSAEYILLDLGTGSMKLDRKYIKSIKYSGHTEREDIKRQWQRKHFLNKKFVPVGHDDLVAEFKKLRLQRDVAARASGAIKTSKRKVGLCEKELEVLKDEYNAANVKLKDVNKDADMLGYNELVRRVNSLVAEINVKVGELGKLNGSFGEMSTAISAYLSELSDFEVMLRLRKNSLPESSGSNVLLFYEGLSERVAEFNKEFPKDVIASKRIGRSTLVTVVVNDKLSGTFVLDTGAELVSISEGFAGRLGIKMNSLPMLDLTVADGRKVSGRAVTLGSVRLGGAFSENVPAVIIPGYNNKRTDHDGLLGMSFLRDYIVRLDGASGNLVLRRTEAVNNYSE